MSDRMTVVIDRRALALRYEHGCLRIDYASDRFRRIPLKLLEHLVVHGNPTIEAKLWSKLAEAGVAAVVLPTRGVGAPAWFGAGLSRFAHWRIRQYRAYIDPKLRARMAATTVQRKLDAFSASLAGMAGPTRFSVFDQIRGSLSAAEDLEVIIGLEGTATRRWFSDFGHRLPAGWVFDGRKRRPPPDPVNALLSLTYTLLAAQACRTITGAGLDPSLGFLHAPAPARASLALDLMEPLRPHCDLFVAELLDGDLTADHFSVSEADGCRLTKAGRAIYYARWFERSESWHYPLPPEPLTESLASLIRRIEHEARQMKSQLEILLDGA